MTWSERRSWREQSKENIVFTLPVWEEPHWTIDNWLLSIFSRMTQSTLILHWLHWLPIQFRLQFNIFVITYRAQGDLAFGPHPLELSSTEHVCCHRRCFWEGLFCDPWLCEFSLWFTVFSTRSHINYKYLLLLLVFIALLNAMKTFVNLWVLYNIME